MAKVKAIELRDVEDSIRFNVELLEELQCSNSNKNVIIHLLLYCADKLQRLAFLCEGEKECPEYILMKMRKVPE